MANLDELRARMDRLGRHLAEAQGRATANRPGNANIRDLAERHAALSARLAGANDADAQMEGEVDALLDSFGRWAEVQDKEFGQR